MHDPHSLTCSSSLWGEAGADFSPPGSGRGKGGVGEPWDSEIHDVSGSGRQWVEQLQCVM